jgi:hypothetical protein
MGRNPWPSAFVTRPADHWGAPAAYARLLVQQADPASEAFAPRLEFGQKQLADIARNGREGRFRQSAILAGHGPSQQRECFRQSIIVFCLHLDFSSIPSSS